MQKNKYKYVSVAAMVAVMLLLGLYMWMTYRWEARDLSDRAGNQLPWAMFYESYNRAEILSKGDTLSLPELRGNLSLVSSVEGMNDVLSRRYHSEVSLDTIALGAILIRLLRYLDEQKMMADLRNDFSYAMVHDMKSPLSSIIMGARFLHSGKVDDKPQIKEKYYSIIESEAEHLLALVNKLLTISKLENKKLILNKQSVNLEPIIDDIVEKAKAKTTKNIDFIVDLLTKHVLADEQYLTEAISNLIDNAIKYSKDNIEISITSQNSEKYVLLKVRDNGIGISKEDQRVIFDKFGRAAVHEQNRKGGVSGFGLGLNYVDQVMQAHGGKVTVQSEKDCYSEFTLYIPKM